MTVVLCLQTEIFKYFDVEPTALPTVVYMHAGHNRYGSMIGKFDKEVVLTHEDKFKNGKLPLQEVKVDKREFIIADIDCPNQQLDEVVSDDDDFDEILAEILAEEKARKEAEEAENGSSKKSGGKKKGKKGKGKKKGGKKDHPDDEL